MHLVLSAARQNSFTYFTKQCPSYLSEVFELACANNLRTRNSYLKLIYSFRKTTPAKTHSLSLVSQYGIKPWRFSKNPTALILSNMTEKDYLTQLK